MTLWLLHRNVFGLLKAGTNGLLFVKTVYITYIVQLFQPNF